MFDARTSIFVLTSVMYYDNLLNVKISIINRRQYTVDGSVIRYVLLRTD